MMYHVAVRFGSEVDCQRAGLSQAILAQYSTQVLVEQQSPLNQGGRGFISIAAQSQHIHYYVLHYVGATVVNTVACSVPNSNPNADLMKLKLTRNWSRFSTSPR